MDVRIRIRSDDDNARVRLRSWDEDARWDIHDTDRDAKAALVESGNDSAAVLIDDAIKTGELPPRYSGPYDVIPDFTVQTLQTENKMLTGNVTVQMIPVHSVTNLSGGKTVTIGLPVLE